MTTEQKAAAEQETLAALFASVRQPQARGLGALYLTDQHRGTIETVLRAIQQGRSLIVLTGEPGIGKTTLLHGALGRLREPDTRVFRFDAPVADTVLQTALGERPARGRTVVAIDRAHLLRRRMLRYLFLTSQAANEAGENLNVLLVGEPVLAIDIEQAIAAPLPARATPHLEGGALASNSDPSDDEVHARGTPLAFDGAGSAPAGHVRGTSVTATPADQAQATPVDGQEASAASRSAAAGRRSRIEAPLLLTLAPFTPEEAMRYVEHRVMASGYPARQLMTPSAVKIIANGSAGLPAHADRLLDLSLKHASEQSQDWITAPVARAARAEDGGRSGRSWMAVTARSAALASVVAGLAAVGYEVLAPDPQTVAEGGRSLTNEAWAGAPSSAGQRSGSMAGVGSGSHSLAPEPRGRIALADAGSPARGAATPAMGGASASSVGDGGASSMGADGATSPSARGLPPVEGVRPRPPAPEQAAAGDTSRGADPTTSASAEGSDPLLRDDGPASAEVKAKLGRLDASLRDLDQAIAQSANAPEHDVPADGSLPANLQAKFDQVDAALRELGQTSGTADAGVPSTAPGGPAPRTSSADPGAGSPTVRSTTSRSATPTDPADQRQVSDTRSGSGSAMTPVPRQPAQQPPDQTSRAADAQVPPAPAVPDQDTTASPGQREPAVAGQGGQDAGGQPKSSQDRVVTAAPPAGSATQAPVSPATDAQPSPQPAPAGQVGSATAVRVAPPALPSEQTTAAQPASGAATDQAAPTAVAPVTPPAAPRERTLATQPATETMPDQPAPSSTAQVSPTAPPPSAPLQTAPPPTAPLQADRPAPAAAAGQPAIAAPSVAQPPSAASVAISDAAGSASSTPGASSAPEASAMATAQGGDGTTATTPTIAAVMPTGEATRPDPASVTGGPAIAPAIRGAATPPAGTATQAARSAAASLPEGVVATLIRRGEDMRARGDISAARLLFDRAAEAGSGAAAMEAGQLRDPSYLTQVRAIGVAADPATAAAWYRRAADLGEPNAAAQLQRLQEAAR